MANQAMVIGAGVAGTVTALALQRAGWRPRIYEAYQHSAGLDHGVFLTLAVNGLDALAAVDADRAVRGLGFETGKLEFASGTGKRLGAMDIGPTLADGTRTRTMRRADLYATLYRLCVDRGIPVVHGKRLEDATTAGATVTARFADGSAATGDVLVGADGLRSRVRSIIDPRAGAPRYTGMGNVGGFSRLSAPGTVGDYVMIWGRRCFFGYTISPDGEVWWFANPPSRDPLTDTELAGIDDDRVRAELIRLLAADRGPAAEIVAATHSPILRGNQFDLPKVAQWHRQSMIVIGDAAHAVSPSTGQGVSLACEDAVVLAQCLRDNADVAAALSRYELLRRERVERVVAWGSKMGGTKTTGPVMRVFRDLALPHILARGATPQAMDKQAWMFEHRIDWAGDTAGASAGC